MVWLLDAPAALISRAAARQHAGLSAQGHRPFPPPRVPWIMGQSWRRLLFAHWPVAPERMRELVPDELPLDLFDGQAWLGITPFEMEGVRPRGLPPAPLLSRFPELNVRTYVVRDGRPGIHFFSLDTSNRPTVAGARALYRLPYFHAQMAVRARDGWIEYAHRRTPEVAFVARYRPTGPAAYAAPGSLEAWLAERYCAHTASHRIDIHHRPWELQPAEAEIATSSVAPLALEGAPHLMYAARQDIVVWPPA